MIHTSLPRNCVVFLLLRELTRSAIYGSQIRLTVLVDEVKGKPCNFEACLCGSLYSTFKTSIYPYAFYKKRLQTLFKDQLDRSKATCSFKVTCCLRTNHLSDFREQVSVCKCCDQRCAGLVLHRSNKGDCLHAPGSLPWCP